MPLYEFQCGSCANRFERIQKFTDPVPDACPKCGGTTIAKLPSSPAIQFKGSGFYITDYAKKSGIEGGKAGAEKSDSGGGDDKSGKSDTSASGAKSDKSDSGGASSSGATPAPAAPASKTTKTD
jgi:putative FmdB family regulatory protein